VRLRLAKNATVVELPERSVWLHEISQKLKATFEKTFWANNCLINLPVKGDAPRRRLFLLELYRTCSKNAQKHDSRFLKRLLESDHKPIKIQITKTLSPTKRVAIVFRVDKRGLSLHLPHDETFMFWHLVHKLKHFDAVYDFFKKQILLPAPSLSLQEEIERFLSNPSLFGYTLAFQVHRPALAKFFEGCADEETEELQAHYQLLNLSHTAKMEELRQRYLQLAKAHHPDLAANNHDLLERTQTFQKIQEAYHAIKAQKRMSA
jgi:hypothetical protein